ncbi:hydroxylysine kinase [Thrips palmi]|uniref:Hydroxylysine kinase n=1 Tax=Thrips palmi TaxID=161013 RepID=A0A6P8YJ76_THRPL|nr:hydroxylysine kinase [Thrips palmi]
MADDALDAMEKPIVDAALALELASRLYGFAGGAITEMVGYDDKNFWLRPSDVTDNPNVKSVAPDGYTLKVTNSLDSRNQDFIDGQNRLLAFLAENGVKCPRPVRNKQGNMHSMEHLREDGPGHAVRLLEFVPGNILGKVPWQRSFPLHVGRELAKITNLMDEIDIPGIKCRTTEWSLWEAPAVMKHLEHVKDPVRKIIVEEVLVAFQRDTEAHKEALQEESGLIHGDYNQYNIVVQRAAEAGEWAVAGVLDLGDCHWAPRLFDVALAGAYMGITSGDLDAVGQVLQGYSEHRPVPAHWVSLLKVCVCARLCQSLVLGLQSHAMDPQNTYVLDSQENGWPLLQTLWRMPHGSIEQQWQEKIKS